MKFTRREFLKYSSYFLGALALPDLLKSKQNQLSFPEGERLGRICAGNEGAWFDLRSEPNILAPSSGIVWRDDVIIWKNEIIANILDYDRYPQRWIETPEGYIYSGMVQPVKNILNEPVTELPTHPDGTRGMWVEITVPYVDIQPVGNKENTQSWIRETLKPRIYYSQVFWAKDIRQTNSNFEYLLMQKVGAWPDTYWVDARACRQITEEETSPINPDEGDKNISIDLNYRTLSCFEGQREVFFTVITSGFQSSEGWVTPTGKHSIWRKMVSTHMSSGELTGPFDLSGIGWTTMFDPNGAAIHSVYWHNDFGSPLSHGCINCRPEDAKWIWRWTIPDVSYFPGDKVIQGTGQSTLVNVIG